MIPERQEGLCSVSPFFTLVLQRSGFCVLKRVRGFEMSWW